MRPEYLLDALRQPEYTGENRCLPCTVVNAVIAVALAAAVALVWLPAGVAALAVFTAAIYLRGYLVPGTPELTRRYFPAWLLRAFGKEPIETPETAQGRAVEADDPEEAERLLRDGGVVEDCPEVDDLCLTAGFREVWWRRIRRYRDEERAAARLGATVGVDPEGLAFDDEGDAFSVAFEGDRVAEWPSEAAFYADLAVEPTLAEYLPGWDELGDRRRTELIAGMRAFLEECPACGADLEQVESVRKSCCAGEVVSVSVDCEACGAQVFAGSYA